MERGISATRFKKAIAAMERDWAHLPEGLLVDIGKRLECAEHLLAFSSICQSWNDACRAVKADWTPKVPWLMLPENKEDHPSSYWTLVDLSINKRYHMELPETFGKRCWGCDDGWICTLGLDMEFHLFNPFTRARIRLPTAHSLPLKECVVGFNNPGGLRWFKSCCIKNVTLSKLPSSGELLICVRYNLCSLAFAKPGDSQWFVIEDPCKSTDSVPFVQEVVSFNGQFLILYQDGKLQSLGCLDRIIGNQKLISEVYVRGDFRGVVSLCNGGSPENIYLVESNGDLLVVLLYKNDLHRFGEVEAESPTRWFQVFKFESEAKDWLQVEDVGNVSLFVGKISSMAISTSNVVHCKTRTIYCIDDETMSEEFNEYDLVLFSLENHQSGEIDTGDNTALKVGSPFWFMPKLV